ncbi:MAG: ATP-dependent DNA helicase RecG [Candidatus Omnitrophota bacterium]
MEKPNDIPIRYLKGVGPKREKTFNKIGVYSIEDLLYYFPRRYEDRAQFSRIADLKEGGVYTIKANIVARGQRRSFRRRGFSIVEAAVTDETGIVYCVWFNQPYLHEYFKAGQGLILYGKVERYAGRLQMSSPEFEIIADHDQEGVAQDESLHVGRIVPVYSLPSGVGQRSFRRLIKLVLDEHLTSLNDFLPYDVRARNNLLNLAKSLVNIHFPENQESQKEAYKRLSFEEFLLFQLPLALRKLKRQEKNGIAHTVEGELVNAFIKNLPFCLTTAQLSALAEIKADMYKPQVMQRLLQGDVGSGKTVVAVIVSLMAIQGGYQVAFMAPTEILARQHYGNIAQRFAAAGGALSQIRMALLTSSGAKREKDRLSKQINDGKLDLVLGTHALLEEAIEFKSLGLVIIDEQHKFGVGQRALLPKKGLNPDVLIMTATPIPRTLAITLYGDLDISVINELPPGRPAITTMHFTQMTKRSAYTIAREQMRQGNQVYIVYPVIEESYALDIAGAKKMYEQFKSGDFKDFRLGLIHGKLKKEEQDAVMLKFRNKELDLLVATTILEVGIDVPSATCMIIQHAERFGLSQLHQLRGRVGRGVNASFCLLISEAKTEESKARLEAMVKYRDGFHIAEEDLKIRGPGEFFGSRQHGLNELKIGNPLTQMHLLKTAREEAIRLTEHDPGLKERNSLALREKLLQRFPEYKKFMLTG